MQAAKRKKTPGNPSRSSWAWGTVLLVVLFVAAIRWRTLDVPLERDEGEYAYLGQLMLQGVPPYKLAYAMKLPGVYAVCALSMAVFGQTAAGIHLGLLLANVAAIVLLFLIGRRVFDPLAGVVAGAFYAVMTLSSAVYGLFAHANQFVVLFAAAGVLMLLRAEESRRWSAYFASGVLLGLGVLMKQHGVVFVLFALLYSLWIEKNAATPDLRRWLRQAAGLCAGVLVPYAIACGLLAGAGAFKEFWFWTFTHSQKYATEITPLTGARLLFRYFKEGVGPTGPLWVFAGVWGLWFAIAAGSPRQRKFVAAFALLSFLGVCLGFYFRPHYFILVLPALGLALGGAVTLARRRLVARGASRAVRNLPAILFAGVSFCVVAAQANVFFKLDPDGISRAVYYNDLFIATKQAGEYIRAHSAPDARVAVLGSEPQICFYAQRRSATGFIYMYDLMGPQTYAAELQRQMMREIEAARPQFAVLMVSQYSWLVQPESDTTIMAWCEDYFPKNYRQTGVIDLISPDETRSVWGEDAAAYVPRGEQHVIVYERK